MSGAPGIGGELLQLRFHFGERDRGGDGPLEAAVVDACARRGVAAAVTLRGVEGFGAKQQMRTDRLLSLSEDAPLLVVAVGETTRVEALADEVRAIAGSGLLTLAPIGIATTSTAEVTMPVGAEAEQVKATVWGPRTGAASPHLGAVAAFHRNLAEAATVLLGVDGVLEGERRRARFVARNQGVPAITVAIGTREAIEAALADLDTPPPLVTVEPVDTYSRYTGADVHGEGVERNSGTDRSTLRGGGVRRSVTVDLPGHHGGEPGDAVGAAATRVALVTSEIAARGAQPRYLALIHALREEGAAGATALRGVWGFRGGREPHGDRVLALRRDVPMLVETVDTAERAERWRELAGELAGTDDLVESQPIPWTITLDRVQAG